MPLLRGAVVTVEVTLLAGILALVMAFIAAFARLSKLAVINIVARTYVEIFRGTSLLVQLFWAFFVLPLFGIEMSAMQVGVLILGLGYGAYASEVVRSSILAVSKGQSEAGIALNMPAKMIMRRVILPQALVIMLPPLGNYLIDLLKCTSLVSLITIQDLMSTAIILNNNSLRTTEIFSLVLLMYFLMAFPLSRGVKRLEKKMAAGRS